MPDAAIPLILVGVGLVLLVVIAATLLPHIRGFVRERALLSRSVTDRTTRLHQLASVRRHRGDDEAAARLTQGEHPPERPRVRHEPGAGA